MAKNHKILVIDDSVLIHRVVSARLKDLGGEVITALDGQSGLDLAFTEQPDLILLDINMPGMSGFDVITSLKNKPATYDIPIIFLSGNEAAEQKIRGFDLGAVDYVTKPFEPTELRARVSNALRSHEMMNMLTEQAQIDGLTGLHNRRYFDERLEQELAEAKRYGHPLSLVITDVDHFKKINDEFGHPKGDQVLRALADTLETESRKGDIACRYGGEEFALILTQTAGSKAYEVVTRLHQHICNLPEFEQLVKRQVTVSMGLAWTLPDEPCAAPHLDEMADKALYQAKRTGRAKVCTHEKECCALPNSSAA